MGYDIKWNHIRYTGVITIQSIHVNTCNNTERNAFATPCNTHFFQWNLDVDPFPSFVPKNAFCTSNGYHGHQDNGGRAPVVDFPNPGAVFFSRISPPQTSGCHERKRGIRCLDMWTSWIELQQMGSFIVRNGDLTGMRTGHDLSCNQAEQFCQGVAVH